jgi:hypothetical protein
MAVNVTLDHGESRGQVVIPATGVFCASNTPRPAICLTPERNFRPFMKLEARSTKFETNPNCQIQMHKTPVPGTRLVRNLGVRWVVLFWILSFEIVSDFVLRISDLSGGIMFINSDTMH